MAFADSDRWELEPLGPEPRGRELHGYSPQAEDLYWSRNYCREPYFRAGYDYEDYASAYCVGYIGCAQYGGRFEDSEKSLCANFIRIKGDSRLTWEEARAPIRAAWDRVEAGDAQGLNRQVSRLLGRMSQAQQVACPV